MKQTKFSLSPYFNKPSKTAIAIFVCLLMASLLLTEIIAALRSPERIEPLPMRTGPNNSMENLTATSALFNSALFGTYVPVNLSVAEIKQSMLDLEVVGILFSGNEKDSQVIIRAAGGEEKAYIIGDSLPGGAILKRISEKSVVVLHNGSLESLSLPKNELLFEGPAKPLIEE